jgi:hypothetical protein
MIVIPMAGLSQRFAQAGYTVPKYMLEAHGRSLFAHSVSSFARYFDDTPFLFIYRDVSNSTEFIARECDRLKVRKWQGIRLAAPTAGQAETVALGLRVAKVADNEPLTIFNIDTFRPGFSFPKNFDANLVDGYLEVFRGQGANWSYVRPQGGDSNRVIETAEKLPISELCCTGLYHFRSVASFLSSYDVFREGGFADQGLKELYVAPMYNLLIKRGADIRFELISADEVIFCGVPAEYEAFVASNATAF